MGPEWDMEHRFAAAWADQQEPVGGKEVWPADRTEHSGSIPFRTGLAGS